MVFEMGDVVRLKSGGPAMTVYGPNQRDPDNIVCQWFDQTGDGSWGTSKTESFKSGMLKKDD